MNHLQDLITSLPQIKQDLLMALPQIKPNLFLCSYCDQHYDAAWFEKENNHCFFCHRFRTSRITRFSLLRETEWFFIQSGGDDARAFYETYFYYLHRWADHFCFDFTMDEKEYQDELVRGLYDQEMNDV